jgi:hypothetical protein
MSSQPGLGPFFNLATLPRPLDSEKGQILASLAYGLSKCKIRKRHEVVAAIDGDGLYIHNVCFPARSFSHAHRSAS